MVALTGFMVAQICFFVVFINCGNIEVLKYVGYLCWALSAVFGWLPIYEFKKSGGVPRGKSYVATTKIVTSGIFSIVRHPQYLAGILLSLAFMLIAQHWLVLVLGLPAIVILYRDMSEADKLGVEKFGEPYRDYMQKVPRANFIWGIIRRISKSN